MTRLGDLGELELIRSLLPHLAPAAEDLLVGAGEDDAAAWREPDGGVTVATCDTMVEGVHFDLAWLAPDEVGWRALALALGDLAAKGAVPTFGLVAASFPGDWEVEAVQGLYRGLSAMAEFAGVRLVGGDTTSTSGPAMISVTVLGRATAPVIPRSRAQAGWRVAVTGRLGAAGAGLRRAMAGEFLTEPSWVAALRRPLPRLKEGAALASAGLCCGDVSDGLVREMDKFAAAAGTGATLLLDRVPVAAGVSPEAALSSGEEVELVCVGTAEAIDVARGLLGCELTVVGELRPDPRVVVIGLDGAELDLADRGFDHFP